MLTVPPVRMRLLPVTMVGLAALLAVKAAGLIEAAYGAGQSPMTKASWPSSTSVGLDPAPSNVPVAPPVVLLAEAPPAPAALADAPADAPAINPGAALEGMPSPAERDLLLDLRKRREELDSRAAQLDQRAGVMAAEEKRLSARVDELSALQRRLEALESARRDRDDSSWRGLVRVYETMRPRDAAVIFNDLDEPVLLQVVDRMKETKVAPILAAMAPDRARRLTADLSALRARANAAPMADSPHPTVPTSATSAASVPNASPPGASP